MDGRTHVPVVCQQGVQREQEDVAQRIQGGVVGDKAFRNRDGAKDFVVERELIQHQVFPFADLSRVEVGERVEVMHLGQRLRELGECNAHLSLH
ncbi:hypothetical protein D3C73_1499120 [compost metagenome]